MDPHYGFFDDNKNLQIDNPLVHKTLAQIEIEAKRFAQRVNPDTPDEALFLKAARIARDPANWQNVADLTKQEEKALAIEKTLGFWRQPKGLRVTIITLCFSAIIQGWTQTGMNGANQGWPGDFGLVDFNGNYTDKNSWIFASVNAITYLTAALFGAWLSDPLQAMFYGRRGAIIVAAALCLASVIGAAGSRNWQQLLACRALIGLSMGAKASVTPIFGAEVSPSHLRGALVMNWQLFDAFGIFLGFTANLIVSQAGAAAWRYQMASAALPALCLLSLAWVIPESPRWLLKKGRLTDAFASTMAIRETPLQAAIELFYANAQVQAEIELLPKKDKGMALESGHETAVHESKRDSWHDDPGDAESSGRTSKPTIKEYFHGVVRYLSSRVADTEVDEYQRRVSATTYWRRFLQLFRNKRIRRATLAAFVVMIGQQLCGVNVIQFYSSTFFSSTVTDRAKHRDDLRALWLSWGIGLANFLFTFPAYWLIDKHGRRFLLLVSYPGMTLSMLGAALSYTGGEKRIAVLGFFVFLFMFFYSWGQGPVPFAYSSEVFPLLNREVGMSFAVYTNLFGAGILTMFVPKLTEAFGHVHDVNDPVGQQRLLGLFTGLNVLALIMIFFFMPETAGAALSKTEISKSGQNTLNYISLEELNYIFGVSTRQHISYQVRHVIPWAWKMCVYGMKKFLRVDDPEKPEKLTEAYEWKRVSVKSNTTGDNGSEAIVGSEKSNEDLPGANSDFHNRGGSHGYAVST